MSINDDASFFIRFFNENRKLRAYKKSPQCISIWIIDLQKKIYIYSHICFALCTSPWRSIIFRKLYANTWNNISINNDKIFVAYCMCTFSHVTFLSSQFNSYIIIQCFSKYNFTRFPLCYDLYRFIPFLSVYLFFSCCIL